MKAAIIGGGFAGHTHAAAIRACGNEIAAVVTSHEESAERFADRWQIPCYGTNPDLAFEDGIDAVHICTPPSLHAAYAAAALRAGKHVFCEKPLSFSSREAWELAALAEKSGKNCTVTFNVRYHMAVQRAREIMMSGCFGRPLLIHGSYLQEFHILPAPYDWRYDPALSGKMRAVTEIGSHWIDTVQYVSGRKVEAVSAHFADFFPERTVADGMMTAVCQPGNPLSTMDDGTASGVRAPKERAGEEDGCSWSGRRIRVDTEDAACVTFRYEDGAMGSVMLSEISHGRGNRLAFEITCEKGSLWWNEEENNVLHTAVRGEGIRSEVFAFGNGFNDTFVSLMRHFYDGKDYPTFEEGAQVVSVCEAIGESAANGSAWTAVKGRTA